MKFINTKELVLLLMAQNKDMLNENEIKDLIQAYGDEYYRGYGSCESWEKAQESDEMKTFRANIKSNFKNPERI